MPTNDYNFNDRGRIPVRPLSFENKDLAIINEVIIDYNNGDIYIKKTNGEIIAAGITQAVEVIKDHIANNPDLVINIKIKYPNNEENEQEVTIGEVFDIIYQNHVDLSDTVAQNKKITDKAMEELLKSVNQSMTDLEQSINKNISENYAEKVHGHNYAGSDTDGGSAKSAKKIDNTLTIVLHTTNDDTGSTNNFDGSSDMTLDVSASNHDHDSKYFKNTGGTINGSIIVTDNSTVRGNQSVNGNSTTTGKHKAGSQEITGDSTIGGDSLFNGKIFLSPDTYGTQLPDNGTEGQLFFKIIEE